MVSIETVYERLAELPAAEPGHWYLASALWQLDPGAAVPAAPPPARLKTDVTALVEYIAAHWPQRAMFAGVRLLERLELVRLEHDDTYVLAMISALGDRHDPAARLDAIRGDDELRETLLWQVFKIEGGGEVSLANVDKFSYPDATWAVCLRTLVADGTLPRERVLDGCLRALARDFGAYRAGFFSRLYTVLAPTAAELTAAQPALRHLLSSRTAATVAFAVRHLTAVERAGALEDEAFAASCAPGLTVAAKGSPLAVLGLLERIARRRPDLAAPVAAAAAPGLEHAHRDVQSKALHLLRELGAREPVAERLHLLEPTVARDAANWLATPPAPHAKTPRPGPDATPAPHAEAPGRGTDTTSAPHVEAPGGALDAIPAPPVQALGAPGLGPGVSPAALTAGERAAALLAGETDPWEIELLLATVAAGTAADELAQLAGSARRALRGEFASLRRNIAAVLLGADLDVRGDLPAARLAEVLAVSVGRARPGVLLATPSDPTGWLDPGEFVARMAAAAGPPAHHDLVAALLKLHPDGRPAALRTARDLPGDAGAAARYALGGPPAPIGDPAVWVAAVRSRAPLDDDPHLVAAGLGGAGQGHAARLGLAVTARSTRYDEGDRQRTVTWWDTEVEVRPAGATTAADRPTVFTPQAQQPDHGPDWIPWTAQVWPHDAEVFFARSIDEVWYAAGPDRSYGAAAVLDALRTHPGRLGPMAAAVLACGLTAHEFGHRLRAAEALAALVPPGRLDAGLLADAMVRIAGHATATRWSAALRDARAAPAVADVLARTLPRLPRAHPGLHSLLAALHEESVRAGAVPGGDGLRAWLAGFAGPSKTARTARALLREAGGAR
ncbi:DUF6493 family protein [Dactylosporangium sp. NPDC000555]|uniref:DUF6493 family protein n=1 Tax=Dactylosporangium sp. NPDC000555 TaxID=3154260 RepID=UPI00332540E4